MKAREGVSRLLRGYNSMSPMNYMTFRACVYPSPEESNYFVAHCLEMDVIGGGDSVEEAISDLLEAIETQIESCAQNNAQLQFFAPPYVWEKYKGAQKAGRKIAGELLDRIFHQANRRLGCEPADILDTIVGTNGIPSECLITA